MPSNQFHLVDVFATEQYAGNQLAVVEDPASLTDEQMQALAAEFGFSETTFVSLTGADERDGESSFHTRIFTPREEIPFAGHPTLGTAWVVRERTGTDDVVLDLPVGEVPVARRSTDGAETLWMRQRDPTFGERRSHERAAEVLGIPTESLNHDLPVQHVSTGLPTVIVPLRDRAALTDVSVNRAAYDAFVADHDAKNVLAFCPDPREAKNDLACRVFAPYYDVPEDPATGSSNGCLAAYLARHDAADGDVTARVEQGYEMGRPSLLFLDAHDEGDEVTVDVGGRVIPVGSGTLQ